MFLAAKGLGRWPISCSKSSAVSRGTVSGAVFNSAVVSQPLIRDSDSFVFPIGCSEITSSEPITTWTALLGSLFSSLDTAEWSPAGSPLFPVPWIPPVVAVSDISNSTLCLDVFLPLEPNVCNTRTSLVVVPS